MKKKALFAIAGVTVAAALLTGAAFMGGSTPLRTSGYKTLTLSPSSLKSTISVTGTVESVTATKVYPMSNGMIIEQNFSVGDTVKEGDVLCRLDSAALERQIEQQEASLSTSARAAQQQIDAALISYSNYKFSLDQNINSSLLTQEAQVNSAKANLDQSKLKYESLDSSMGDDAADYRSAYNYKKDCEKELKDAETSGNAAAIAAAKVKYETAKAQYEATRSMYKTISDSYDQAEAGLAASQKAYDSAVNALQAAQIASGQQLTSYAENYKNAEANAANEASLVALNGLKQQLEDMVVKAPISGTITAAYAKKGAPATGLLYLIEDTEKLQISTSIKEYDITQVKLGMDAVITTDATGDEEFGGKVTEIAPTALKAADGSTISGTNVEFGAKIAVSSASTPLKIGMNTRMDIVLEEKENVFAVPFDVVVEQADGAIVYGLGQNAKGEPVAKAIPITLGMETDFYVEISGEGLKDGIKLVSNPDGLKDGDVIKLEAGA